MSTDENKASLITFLKNITKSIEDSSINEEKLKLVREFYTSYSLQNIECPDEFSEKEILKFLTMGWYVYNHI